MQKLFRRPALQAQAVPHNQNAVADAADQRGVVGDEDNRELILQADEKIRHLLLGQDIQRTGGLVTEQNIRFRQNGAKHRHSLALAAAELSRRAVQQFL